MNNLSAIVVDDEPLARDRLRRFIQSTKGLTLVAECPGGASAVKAIQQHTPNLVFLDIQMPDLDGFGVIEVLTDTMTQVPAIIFVTAYDQHAIKAFEINALDYLLKPVHESRFRAAVERARIHAQEQTDPSLHDKLKQFLMHSAAPSPDSYIKRIEVKTGERVDYIPVETIRWIEADRNYLELHTATKTHLARMTLAELEAALDPSRFIRISRSSLINLDAVESIKLQGRRDHIVVLQSGEQLPITRGLTKLRQRLQFPQ